ncbi:MAG: hypothetical protein F6J93_03625 [Oscillatoria sp. SIO1A7]|nr:hypothetical protein [Oscillatoria sp. SIO1A7]
MITKDYYNAMSSAFDVNIFDNSCPIIPNARASLAIAKLGLENEAIACLFLGHNVYSVAEDWGNEIAGIVEEFAECRDWSNASNSTKLVLAAIAMERENISADRLRALEGCSLIPEKWILDLKLLVNLNSSLKC